MARCRSVGVRPTRRRVVVPDYATDEAYQGTEAAQAHIEAGVRAAQSTPLVSRYGRMVGMLSTHWSKPHRPDERELRLLDVLVRQAADLIERAHAETALREFSA